MSNLVDRGRRQLLLAGVAVMSLVCASCGLASGANRDLSKAITSGGGNNGGSLGLGTGSSGGTGAASASASGAGSASGGAGSAGASTAGGAVSGSSGAAGGTGAATGAGGSTGGGAGGAPSAQAAYETIGIRSGVIYLGLHAPATGAAPIPLQAFATGTKLFWENHTVFGHQVVMNFMDDQYNPSVARQVCESMSRQDLLVIGGAGTDQIQACATDPVLSSTHTPYFSAGVTTNGLTGLPYYFAVSQTYAAQSSNVLAMTSQLYGGDATAKWAVVTENTPNFTDTTQAMEQVLRSKGIAYCEVRPPKYYSDSDVSNTVTQTKSCGAKVVYLDVDPNFWIAMVRDASAQLFTPDWVGPGITNGEDLVATPVCGEQPSIKAAFLSPYMGLDRQPPDFSGESNPAPDAPAAERDIELLIYGASQVAYDAMLSLGSFANLTRDNLIAAMAKFSASYGSQLTVFPTVNMAGGQGHFGGTGMWELQLSCSQAQYLTAGRL
ncbi:MAG TPA: ABC transporter substrate-binding protein [Acidimicrobiales bacterium]|nr:ABC transporter substrate-binding protein [Acidimicrobiales bacterium]